MKCLYKESSGNEVFALEEGDAEMLFPLYAKEPLIFSSDSWTVKEAILAQMELNRIAGRAYFEHLQEKGKDANSKEAQHRLRQIEDSMRSISFYLSGRPEDIINYGWTMTDAENIIAEVLIEKPTAGFPGTG